MDLNNKTISLIVIFIVIVVILIIATSYISGNHLFGSVLSDFFKHSINPHSDLFFGISW
jgi:hypothetical protein